MTVDKMEKIDRSDAPPRVDRLSEGIVNAVAAKLNLEPAATSADENSANVLDPLYSVVDPDALDALFRPTRSNAERTEGQVTFPYHGHEVTAHSDGRVFVKPLSSPGKSGE